MIAALRRSPLVADPRHGQICALVVLISCGVAFFAFEMPWWRPVAAAGAAVGTQFAVARVAGWRFDWRSPLISSLSLTLLLRTEGPALAALAGVIVVLSKALVRVDGRHFLNPAATAIVATATLFPGAWISPGQWGTEAWIAVLAAGTGLLVTGHAKRWEVPFAFLAAWAALAFARALWLGDPMAIPLHQMQSGALVIFAFFMISDPMTAPWHVGARIAWVVAVAAIGFALQFTWVVTAGPIYGLVIAGPLVPVLNSVLRAPRAHWRPERASPHSRPKGVPA